MHASTSVTSQPTEMLSPQQEQLLFKVLRRPQQRALCPPPDGGTLPLSPEVGASREAEAQIINAHQPLVRTLARQIYLKNLGFSQFEDLVSAGNEGLLIATRRYDPKRGVRFNTFARWWIRNGIFKQVRFDRWFIHIPEQLYKAARKVLAALPHLRQELHREPTIEEFARRVDWPVSVLRQLRKVIAWATVHDISLDTPVGEAGESTLGEFVSDDQRLWTTPNSDPILASALRETVAATLKKLLTSREEEVIRMRFGFDGDRQMTLEEIGRKFALSRQRIRQIESQALRKLRNPQQTKLLRPFVIGRP